MTLTKSAREESIRTMSAEFDELYQSWMSRMTLGLTPAGLVETYASWLAHLAISPGRLSELAAYPILHAWDRHLIDPADDSRFRAPEWQRLPWSALAVTHMMKESFWDRATTAISGLAPERERAINFATKQMLNAFSPANFLPTNPEALAKNYETGGAALVNGLQHAVKNWISLVNGEAPEGTEKYVPGETVAVTPGKVVFSNDLMELIQYEPATAQVQKEPILILPAWIMKYYILDLSPHNSMVKWLVSEGHTVFIVSWKNPNGDDRDKGLDDYVRSGALAALDVVSHIFPDTQIHLTGYCLGGTLAMLTAAYMAAMKDKRLKSLSLFAAQGDFTEMGEMMVFITSSEVAYLQNMMRVQGYLDTKQMAGAFQMLRSNDLIWTSAVKEYLLGQETPLNDLMAWNADATRMPYKMHSEYLEKLCLNNMFANGRFKVLGKPVAAESITVPIFAVGTEKDHVAPWHSVYKIHLMASSDVTFVLTSGGHNSGIVNEPGHPGRHYRICAHKQGEPFRDADEWAVCAEQRDGSWWLAWNDWLKENGDVATYAARTHLGDDEYKPLRPAPGLYVLQR